MKSADSASMRNGPFLFAVSIGLCLSSATAVVAASRELKDPTQIAGQVPGQAPTPTQIPAPAPGQTSTQPPGQTSGQASGQAPAPVPISISQSLPSDEAYLRGVMTPWATELADMIEISPLLQKLHKEQQRAKALGPSSASVERLLAIQRLMYLRAKIDVFIQTASLEVGSVMGKLNSGLADLADTKALIADTRARTLRRQSFINFISGGLTKIGGYSIALTPASLIPTNVLEIFDGGVQTGLSAFTLKQLKEEQQLGKARPEILRTFLNGNNMSADIFPETVWSYLNRVPPQSKDGKTRRQTLIDTWVKIGRLSDGKSQSLAKRQNSPFQLSNEFRLDALDDTVAMMSDLKSVIASMDTSLMELGQAYRDSYNDDPDI